jgi:Domain of unknown function (DUF4386)
VQTPHARTTGAVYLAFFLTAILGALLTSHKLVDAGNAVSLFSNACYFALAFLFYFMFKPVSQDVSLLAACCCVTGCVVGSLALYDMVSARLNPLFFFGPYCALLGYLIFRSTFLPLTIGVLMMLAGVAWLVELIPPLSKPIFPFVAVIGIVAEAALMLWLLIKGVNQERWKQKVIAHSSGG